MKNIPIANNKEYIIGLTHSNREFVNNLRWIVLFHLNPSKSQDTKQYFGLKSNNRCEPIKELKEFEDKLHGIVKNVEFRNVSNSFQNKLRADINKIKNEPKVFMKADKTTNYYKVDPAKCDDMIEKEVTKGYKKATPNILDEIKAEAISIATDLGVEDRIFATSENPAYNTLKDHKDDFKNNPKCRQINPCKPELGKVSKHRLDEIANIVREESGLVQFKNTQQFVSWYEAQKDKDQSSFYQMDICNFYPSITEKLINKAIDFAAQYTDITEEDRKLILHTSKSLLYHKGQAWVKKGKSLIDVTQGGLDGAEKCDLVGLYILSKLSEIDGIEAGLFRDDGAAITKLPPKEAEKVKNKIVKGRRS